MTPKTERFCEEYILDLNATEAAKRAGYRASTARQLGSRCLQNPEVQARIAELQAKRSRRTEITADTVLAELAKIGFANMLDYMRVGADGDPVLDFSKLTREQAAALAEVTVEDFKDGRGDETRDVRRVKFKLADKRAALVDIGKHLGMFKDKVELTGKDGGPIEVDDVRDRISRRIAGVAARSGTREDPGGSDGSGSGGA